MPSYSIIFEGRKLADVSADQAQANAARLFKITDPAKVEKLFSGKEVVIKRGLDKPKSEYYLKRLTEAGLSCKLRLEADSDSLPISKPVQNVASSDKPPPAALSLAPVEPKPEPDAEAIPEPVEPVKPRLTKPGSASGTSASSSHASRGLGRDNSSARTRTAAVGMQRENTSGLGAASAVPEEVRGWCWGGFLLGWIWAIGNRTWIGLLGLIPLLSLPVAILLGIKGREWAWRNKSWDSVASFNNTQRIWSMVGTLVLVLGLVFYWQVFRISEEAVASLDEKGLPSDEFIEQIEDEEMREQLERFRKEMEDELEKINQPKPN